MVHLTPGVRTTRHLREGPGITFLVLGRTFGLQHSTEWNSYLQNEFLKKGRPILVSAGTSISVSASHWSYDLHLISKICNSIHTDCHQKTIVNALSLDKGNVSRAIGKLIAAEHISGDAVRGYDVRQHADNADKW